MILSWPVTELAPLTSVSVKVTLEVSAPVETGTPLVTAPKPLSIVAVPPGPESKTAVRVTPCPEPTLAADVVKLVRVGTKDDEIVSVVCFVEVAVKEP